MEKFEAELRTFIDSGAVDGDVAMLDEDGATVDNGRALFEFLAIVRKATYLKLSAQLIDENQCDFNGKAALQEALIEVFSKSGARNPYFASYEFRSQMMQYGGNKRREPFVNSLQIGEDHILLLVVCQEDELPDMLDFIWNNTIMDELQSCVAGGFKNIGLIAVSAETQDSHEYLRMLDQNISSYPVIFMSQVAHYPNIVANYINKRLVTETAEVVRQRGAVQNLATGETNSFADLMNHSISTLVETQGPRPPNAHGKKDGDKDENKGLLPSCLVYAQMQTGKSVVIAVLIHIVYMRLRSLRSGPVPTYSAATKKRKLNDNPIFRGNCLPIIVHTLEGRNAGYQLTVKLAEYMRVLQGNELNIQVPEICFFDRGVIYHGGQAKLVKSRVWAQHSRRDNINVSTPEEMRRKVLSTGGIVVILRQRSHARSIKADLVSLAKRYKKGGKLVKCIHVGDEFDFTFDEGNHSSPNDVSGVLNELCGFQQSNKEWHAATTYFRSFTLIVSATVNTLLRPQNRTKYRIENIVTLAPLPSFWYNSVQNMAFNDFMNFDEGTEAFVESVMNHSIRSLALDSTRGLLSANVDRAVEFHNCIQRGQFKGKDNYLVMIYTGNDVLIVGYPKINSAETEVGINWKRAPITHTDSQVCIELAGKIGCSGAEIPTITDVATCKDLPKYISELLSLYHDKHIFIVGYFMMARGMSFRGALRGRGVTHMCVYRWHTSVRDAVQRIGRACGQFLKPNHHPDWHDHETGSDDLDFIRRIGLGNEEWVWPASHTHSQKYLIFGPRQSDVIHFANWMRHNCGSTINNESWTDDVLAAYRNEHSVQLQTDMTKVFIIGPWERIYKDPKTRISATTIRNYHEDILGSIAKIVRGNKQTLSGW